MPRKQVWDTYAERDMMFAAWYASTKGECNTDWDEVSKVMVELGHSFTKDELR